MGRNTRVGSSPTGGTIRYLKYTMWCSKQMGKRDLNMNTCRKVGKTSFRKVRNRLTPGYPSGSLELIAYTNNCMNPDVRLFTTLNIIGRYNYLWFSNWYNRSSKVIWGGLHQSVRLDKQEKGVHSLIKTPIRCLVSNGV